jgi:PhzF family phenazine biosynthesis protein
MQLRLVQLDAFADRVFGGNPAAVMPLPHWLPDPTLQRIAAENNLSETAFYTADLPAAADRPGVDAPAYHLRWFTPATEVDLCGHATLATAGQLFDDAHPDADTLAFWTRSGWLLVRRGDAPRSLTMDFPAGELRPAAPDPALASALGVAPVEWHRDTDLVLVLSDAAAVRAATPDFAVLARLPLRGVVVTAPGDEPGVDVVSRWFGARAGLFEDPVTGSAHSQFAAYWAARLGRDTFHARQLSARGGAVGCRVVGDRVHLTGGYVRYLDGMVTLPDE